MATVGSEVPQPKRKPRMRYERTTGRYVLYFIEPLFKRWHKPLRQWLVGNSRVGAKNADDMVQEVFLRLLKYCDQGAITNPQGYLFRVAENVVNEWADRSVNKREHVEIDAKTADRFHELICEMGADDSVVPSQRAALLRQQIDKLPERARRILLLHIHDGLTYKQIAAETGLTYRLILRDLSNSYATLRASIDREDL